MDKVIIVVEVAAIDLIFRVVCPVKGISPLFRHPGRAAWLGGNPYLIYGKEAAAWTGRPYLDLILVVSTVTSNTLME